MQAGGLDGTLYQEWLAYDTIIKVWTLEDAFFLSYFKVNLE